MYLRAEDRAGNLIIPEHPFEKPPVPGDKMRWEEKVWVVCDVPLIWYRRSYPTGPKWVGILTVQEAA